MQSILNFSYGVVETTGGAQYDLQLNVIRPCIHLRHDLTPPDRAVVIAFTNTPALSIDRNLRITPDIASTFAQLPPQGLEQFFDSMSFNVPSRDFFLTDVFVTNLDGSHIPLYYCHSLPITAAPHSPVSIYDKDMNLVIDQPYYYWRTSTENSIFNNIQSTYNQETGDYEVYYVSYVDADGINQIELLNNEPAFKELKLEDYSEFGTDKRHYVVYDYDTYLLVTCLFNYKAYSPTPYGLSYRVPKEAFGELLPPDKLDVSNPWIPKISNFDTYQQGIDGNIRHYYIPEFYQQNFSPYYPYKSDILSSGFIVTKTLLKTIHKNICLDPERGFNIDVIVTKANGNLRYAFTTDTSKTVYVDSIGNQTSHRYRYDGFSSFDLLNGFIKLNFEIGYTDTVTISYCFSSSYYDYAQINLNPLLDPEIATKEVVVFMVPPVVFSHLISIFIDESEINEIALSDLVSKAYPSFFVNQIYHTLSGSFWDSSQILIIDGLGETLDMSFVDRALASSKLLIVNYSQYQAIKAHLNVGDTATLTHKDLSLPYINYGGGYVFCGNDGVIEGIGASWAAMQRTGWFRDTWFSGFGWFGSGERGDLIDIWRQMMAIVEGSFSAVEITRGIYHLLLDHNSIITSCAYPYNIVGQPYDIFLNDYSLAGNNSNQCLVLGHAKVLGDGALLGQTTIVDCRQRGGGFRDDIDINDILKRCPEADWCFDQGSFDGHAFPGASAIMIELPYTILSNYGGNFTAKEVLDKVKKNLAAGTYPVIRYYGPLDPKILNYNLTSTSISISWEDINSPCTVYWGIDPEALVNSAIVDGTSYTIQNLKAGLSYTILVTPIIDNSRILNQEYLTFSLPIGA